jgi:hypothetical protein
MSPRFAIIAFGLLALTPAAHAGERPIVVELFTSQGCSSCPPADALLLQLAQRPDVLALAFHVTYWNGLGWRDPFSLDSATQRQREYQHLMHTGTIYTPQMVVDGRIDVVGSDRSGVAAALTAARAHAGAHVPLDIARTPDGLRITVSAGAGEANLLLIGYDLRHTTPVARGENAGARLTEANIVRSQEVLARWQGRPLSLMAPILVSDRVAVILQAPDGRILGAAVLPPSPRDVAG